MIAGCARSRCSLIATSSATASLGRRRHVGHRLRRDRRVGEQLLHDGRVVRVLGREQRQHARGEVARERAVEDGSRELPERRLRRGGERRVARLREERDDGDGLPGLDAGRHAARRHLLHRACRRRVEELAGRGGELPEVDGRVHCRRV